MMTIMNSVSTTEMKGIFGITYCTTNDNTTLSDNYNNILSERGYLLSKLYYFLDNSDVLYQLLKMYLEKILQSRLLKIQS